MANTTTERTLNELKPTIIRVVSSKLAQIKEGTQDVAIAWKKMQDVAAKEIISLISEHLPDSEITSPTSKSTYPDIKIVNSEGQFAIDIKANEDSKQPWFDMARLDTMLADRLEKYIEEWEFVIRFNSTNGQFIKAYFFLFREVVGIRNECAGVKYRPYDGKVRPKSWDDFDNEVVYWDSKEKFLQGINNSIKHRWKTNIKKHLVPKLSREEKKVFKKLFE
jgi:hypothetical protein